MTCPSIRFNNGISAPQVGLGTWQSKDDNVAAAVEHAVKSGYRHIDTAFLYFNEKAIGATLSKVFHEGVVKREDLFITTKLGNIYHEPARVRRAVEASLTNLGLSYIDLYLIHTPVALRYIDDNTHFPQLANGQVDWVKSDHVATWHELEKLVEEGLIRSIGLSNFSARQVDNVVAHCSIKPVTNQVECHAYFPQRELQEACLKHGIVLTAYAPIGSPGRSVGRKAHFGKSDDTSDEPDLLSNEELKAIGKSHGKSVAQVAIRWLVQRGVMVIPKSVTPKRIEENFDVFEFVLSQEEMKRIDKIGEKPVRLFEMKVFAGAPDWNM